MVDSCRICANCKAEPGAVLREGLRRHLQRQGLRRRASRTAATPTTSSATSATSTRISPKFGDKLAGVAPLLCAGITTYSPLRHWGAGPGKKVGIVGLGGLGHMGLKFAHSFGAHVVQFTTSREQDRRRPASRRGRGRHLQGRRRDGQARRPASTSSSTASPPRTT